MSRNPSDSATRCSALDHAGEVAQWTVPLLGWLWLGEQGMRLGWPLASGVLAVAVWWSVRIVCRDSAWVFRCGPAVLGLGGLFTAVGVWLPSWVSGPSAQHASLIGVALVWGLWNALTDAHSRAGISPAGRLAWHPVLAAGLVIGAWRWSDQAHLAPWGVSLLLALCAAVLHLRGRRVGESQIACPGPHHSLQHLLAPAAMGLMMGSLWLNNGWCAGLGFSTEDMVMLHLVFMAGLPTVVAFLLSCPRPAAHLSPAAQTQASLALLVLGALMMLGSTVTHSMLSMLLPSLAWAVHGTSHRASGPQRSGHSPWLVRSMALCLGPALLVGVGVASPLHGPLAVQSAMALLGVLAFAQAVLLLGRMPAQDRHLSVT